MVIGAIFVPGWPRWVLIAGAVVLPYLAVVIANAGRERDRGTPTEVTAQPQPALPASGAAIEGVVIVPQEAGAGCDRCPDRRRTSKEFASHARWEERL